MKFVIQYFVFSIYFFNNLNLSYAIPLDKFITPQSLSHESVDFSEAESIVESKDSLGDKREIEIIILNQGFISADISGGALDVTATDTMSGLVTIKWKMPRRLKRSGKLAGSIKFKVEYFKVHEEENTTYIGQVGFEVAGKKHDNSRHTTSMFNMGYGLTSDVKNKTFRIQFDEAVKFSQIDYIKMTVNVQKTSIRISRVELEDGDASLRKQ